MNAVVHTQLCSEEDHQSLSIETEMTSFRVVESTTNFVAPIKTSQKKIYIAE